MSVYEVVFGNVGEQLLDVWNTGLPVTVDQDKDITARGDHSMIEGRALAGSSRQGDQVDPELAHQDPIGFVFASIVDGNDFRFWMKGLDLLDDAGCVFFLIVERDDDRNFHES